MNRTVVNIYCNRMLTEGKTLQEIQEFCTKHAALMCSFMPVRIEEVEQRAAFDRHCIREQKVIEFRRSLK